jgi:hypothetical protein
MSMGDVFECLAIKKLYEKMGVPEENIITCNAYDLSEYRGEYVVLPINIYSVHFDYSSRILPVFLGLTLGGAERTLTEREEHILRKFQPVGCRDERTLRLLLDKGLDAYFAGCMVATFPARDPSLAETAKKVYFVDAHAGIKDYIPAELLDDYAFFSHDFYMTPEEMLHRQGAGDIFVMGEAVIKDYAANARLIVTSKFHAAIIGLALGIPVILLMENNYYKYTWITKYIPLYEPKDFPKINWNPAPVIIPNDEKALMTDIAINRIQETYDKYYKRCSLSEIRENVDLEEFDDIVYANTAIEYIKKNWPEDAAIEYSLWGVTQTAIKLDEYIASHYPNARLMKVFDFSNRTEFIPAKRRGGGGLFPEASENLAQYPGLFVFVTSNSAAETAIELFEKIHKPQDEYFLCQRTILALADIVDTRPGVGGD